uniref:Uncharacterized protein AlNc14C785G12507 n=1 Tax=Albugo laibachii Nc14 TaxID=890382 RepID=F0X215_9STRA|nr:conserved hypothetical protein [Albugo laibachii Nc14]|eukprot:CCA27876.1 conserved hypothetical protein [Albugo laibachii Nc14]
MPSTSTSAHPVHLRLGKEMEDTLVGLYDAGIPTRSIQTCLRKDHELILAKNKLKNVRQASSNKALDGRTPMDALVEKFCGLEFDVEAIVNEYDGCIRQLLFAHPSSTEMARSHNDVFLVDATYKTNAFGFNERMKSEGRHVLLLLDNVSSHRVTAPLSNVTVQMLPPTRRLSSQPQDAGIIQSFKSHLEQLNTRYNVGKFDELLDKVAEVGNENVETQIESLYTVDVI